MTDEERAREIVQRHGRILPPERQMELGLAIWDAIQVSRADEREKCAQELEAWGDIYGRNAAAAIRERGRK